MQATSGEQSIVDIGLTSKVNKKIILSILTAHAASGCNTIAPQKRWKKQLKLLGNTEACIDEAVNKWILNK